MRKRPWPKTRTAARATVENILAAAKLPGWVAILREPNSADAYYLSVNLGGDQDGQAQLEALRLHLPYEGVSVSLHIRTSGRVGPLIIIRPERNPNP